MKKTDQSSINLSNKVNILNALWHNHSIFKAEIARKVNLSLPTVMKITDELSEKGLVNIVGKGVSSGGKPPMMLELNKNAHYVIGVDINEYRVEIVLVNLLLGIEEQHIQDIRANDTAAIIIERIISEINRIIDNNKEKSERILGIGVGVPGLIDHHRGFIKHSSEMNWHDVRMKEALLKAFDGEIIIEESTRAIALEEKRLGGANNAKNFLCINIGSGIGSALVINENLYYGNSESSGQLGHMVVERKGTICDCGNHGCLEQYVSGDAIARIAKERVRKEKDSQILDLVYGDLEKIDVYIVFESAKNGDKTALEILDEAADYLAMAIVSVINLVDPELIIFEGKVCRTGDIFMKIFENKLHERQMKYLGRNIRIIISGNGDNIGSVGAASFIFEKFINCGGEHFQILKRI